ncbi:MAG: hypothetical protein WD572_08120 [Gammaproteobacteria bacterium]
MNGSATSADGNIKLLEMNPNPGWCWDGKLNLMAEYGGMRYSELLQAILDAAAERILQGQRAVEKDKLMAAL